MGLLLGQLRFRFSFSRVFSLILISYRFLSMVSHGSKHPSH